MSRRGARRAYVRAVAASLPLLVAAACARDVDPAYSRGSTVTIAYDENWFDPEADMPAKFLTFLSLTAVNEKGELEGRLASRWEHSADFKEWTYHLRTDVRWQDGVPTTAHDVKFTLDLLVEHGLWVIEDVTVIDDSTVTIRAPQHNYIDYVVYCPKHLLDGLDRKKFWEWEFWFQPLGNGPYRFVRYMPQTLMEFR